MTQKSGRTTASYSRAYHSDTGVGRHSILYEVLGLTVAGSLALRLLLLVMPTLPWVASLVWLYGPLVPLTLRRLPFAPYGYSLQPWYRTTGHALCVSLALLGTFALLILGWRLLAGVSLRLYVNALSWEIMLQQLVCVAMPEELFFRGYVQERLRLWAWQRSLPHHTTAILLSAGLFTAVHLMVLPSWWRLAVFVPGCVMGWLRVSSRGLLAPTLFHWLANLLALVLRL